MYLDAMFSISQEGIDTMKNLTVDERMDYILGIGKDESFIDYMINIVDYKDTTHLFYDVLIRELKLFELNERKAKKLYKDAYFLILYIENFKVKKLQEKLHTLKAEHTENIMNLADKISKGSVYKGSEKYLEFKCLIEEAVLKEGSLLLIMRFK